MTSASAAGEMNVSLFLLISLTPWIICATTGGGGAERGEATGVLLRDKSAEGVGRRTCRLYCRVGIGFHLQIYPDGKVNGSHEANRLSILELIAVSQGIIGIRGVYSNRFLAMNKRGRLHATEVFTDDCKFRERFQENSYNTYASVIHRSQRTGRDWFVALNKRGKAKMGSSPGVKAQHVSTHFLPRAHVQEERSGHVGFTITNRRKDRRKLLTQTSKPAVVKANVHAGLTRRRAQVKYWPKYRFG